MQKTAATACHNPKIDPTHDSLTSASLLTVTLHAPNTMKSSVGLTLCWCALLCCLLFSLFDQFDPDPITKLPISVSFDHFNQQQVYFWSSVFSAQGTTMEQL